MFKAENGISIKERPDGILLLEKADGSRAFLPKDEKEALSAFFSQGKPALEVVEEKDGLVVVKLTKEENETLKKLLANQAQAALD